MISHVIDTAKKYNYVYIPVLDGDKYAGVCAMYDLLGKDFDQTLESVTLKRTPTISQDSSIEDVYRLIHSGDWPCVVVTDAERVIGLIERSIVDIVCSSLEEFENVDHSDCNPLTDQVKLNSFYFSPGQLRFALSGSGAGLWDWHIQSGEAYFDARWAEIIGYTYSELLPGSFETIEKLIHQDDRQKVNESLQQHFDGITKYYEVELRMKHKDGHFVWIQSRGRVVERDTKNRPLRMSGTHLDITARKKSEERLRLAATVFENAHEGIIITNENGEIIEVNNSFEKLTGFSYDEAVGENPRILKSGRHNAQFYENIWDSIINKGYWLGEIWNKKKSGEIFVSNTTILSVRADEKSISHFVGIFTDVTLLRMKEEQIEHFSQFDSLTHLPNRLILADRIEQSLARARRTKTRVAVAYLDLDSFKPINDKIGHDAGDRLISEIALRLKENVREGDTVARPGGDEFVLLLTDIGSREECENTLKRLLDIISKPFPVDGLPIHVTMSVGVTLYPEDSSDAETLLRHSDQAMHEAKQSGRNRYHFFDQDHDKRLQARSEAAGQIKEGILNGEFVLYYQPKVNMRLGSVFGLEALIRWNHPQKGLLQPSEFLPIINETPIANLIDEWVIDTVLSKMRSWKEKDDLEISVSVNISPGHLQSSGFPELLKSLLEKYPEIPSSSLELEVLETGALEDMERVSQIMTQCRSLGVRFSLDDFGTGYSSLTYFRRLPVDTLKIDRSFVMDMLTNENDLAIVEGVVGLANAFSCHVIAEGVESTDHGSLLLKLGCDRAQGYGISKPMPADQVAAWIHSYDSPVDWYDSSSAQWRVKDLPLLSMGLIHENWVHRFIYFLNQDEIIGEGPPPLGHHDCRFGQWYDTTGRARYGQMTEFQHLQPIHETIHTLVLEMHTMKISGRSQEAHAKIPELLELKERMIVQLDRLVEQVTKLIIPGSGRGVF